MYKWLHANHKLHKQKFKGSNALGKVALPQIPPSYIYLLFKI